ncbi:uncharacterized protein SCHCODRAFT_02643598 [Schizophyllum commune H4-8]|uniref:uncharacterized protein n=1 Tax=Schizophyllum commune (strain H4-8 / FGSC 9210) TaxID=578458 RepID=UPI00216077F8|nr:uncharacterized protein SCHCODRAFT_02643598 [Schizophyllum commune H4-8]KAI5886240.1 hypothetical protein SCHCODRAFT_02643598 [Schizophyllum commune H4-8]
MTCGAYKVTPPRGCRRPACPARAHHPPAASRRARPTPPDRPRAGAPIARVQAIPNIDLVFGSWGDLSASATIALTLLLAFPGRHTRYGAF